MSYLGKIIPAVALALGLAISPTSSDAATFTVDLDNSSVSVVRTSGFGHVSGALALEDGYTFDVDTGDTNTFDFLRFSTNSRFLFGDFSIQATLAFLAPEEFSVGSSGIMNAVSLLGSISAGTLNWTGVPTEFTLADGSTIGVNFQGGRSVFLGNSITTTASVTGIDIVDAPAPVPLPAAGFLLLGALGGLGLMRRRKKA